MALIDKASLLMVPSTYEAGKLYNVLPSGNRAPDNKGGAGYDQTRADFDFDRGSNAAATRINSSGLIEKYRENLLTESNIFSDSDWTNSNITLTSGQEDPFGGSNGWRYLMSGGIGSSYLYQNNKTINGSVMVLSFWVKSNTGSNQTFRATANSGGQASPDFTATTSWQRFSWFFISNAGNSNILLAYNSSTNSDLLIYGAQFEIGLVPTDYLNSTSVTAKVGVLIDLPRINYDANGENGALLLEPSRLNAVQFSEYFGAWTNASNATITHNSLISPEGVKNAAYLQFSNANQSINLNSNLATGVICTASVYIKGTAGETIRIAAGGADSPNLTLSGEWQRLEHTATSLNSSININTYGGATARNVYIYGAMLEPNASYKSSYIPNHGTSGGVTRAADSCSVTGVSDVIGQTEGTLFVEAETLENGADCRITISDNTINNRVSIEWDANADTIKGFIGTAGNLFTSSYNQTNRNKIAIVYNSSDARFFVNGIKVDTDTTISILSGMNRVDFSNYGGALPFVGKVYKMYMSEEKLTDAEAVTLTTL